MIIHPAEQGSVDWSIARSGIPTASEFDNLITPKGEIRTGETPKSYLASKLAEKWLGGPLLSFNSFDAEQGSILEHEARPWLLFDRGIDAKRVGLCLTDDGNAGASPDGLVFSEVGEPKPPIYGLEIKCPAPQTHVKYLLNGSLPPEYFAQVHGSLYITGLPMWLFVSYRRNMPALVLTIHRDEAICKALDEALGAFNEKLDAGYNRLCELNGGPPKRVKQGVTQPMPEPDLSEIIP